MTHLISEQQTNTTLPLRFSCSTLSPLGRREADLPLRRGKSDPGSFVIDQWHTVCTKTALAERVWEEDEKHTLHTQTGISTSVHRGAKVSAPSSTVSPLPPASAQIPLFTMFMPLHQDKQNFISSDKTLWKISTTKNESQSPPKGIYWVDTSLNIPGVLIWRVSREIEPIGDRCKGLAHIFWRLRSPKIFGQQASDPGEPKAQSQSKSKGLRAGELMVKIPD